MVRIPSKRRREQLWRCHVQSMYHLLAKITEKTLRSGTGYPRLWGGCIRFDLISTDDSFRMEIRPSEVHLYRNARLLTAFPLTERGVSDCVASLRSILVALWRDTVKARGALLEASMLHGVLLRIGEELEAMDLIRVPEILER